MSTEITVRLADDIVRFIDQVVTDGLAPSRAAVVAQALKRECRRRIAERDAAILTQVHEAADLNDLARYASSTSKVDLD